MEKSLKIIENRFGREPVYGDNDKYIKIKVEVYTDNMNIFRAKKIRQKKAPCKCLSIILLDSVIKAKNYPQIFLEECKYKQEKIKLENLIDDDLEKSSPDESDSESGKDDDKCNE